jgi:hypothetical protein
MRKIFVSLVVVVMVVVVVVAVAAAASASLCIRALLHCVYQLYFCIVKAN